MDQSIISIINQKIEAIRPKLLDLSRRNPLISTSFSIRSNSHIRVVDEQPKFLFNALKNNEKLRLASLPDLDIDPKDELTNNFKIEFEKQKEIDPEFLDFLKDNPLIDYFSDELNREERKLKDRVRIILELLERPDKSVITMAQHAKINNISSSYDLPDKEESNNDNRWEDDEIQTLLLENQLQKKANSLLSKSKSFIDETGINVLQAAFGFIEWKDNDNDKTSLAPIILVPIQINKKVSIKGAQFWLTGIEGEFEVNKVLEEKLRIENKIELPVLIEDDIEDYFEKLDKMFNDNPNFRVRRQIALGIFPSSKIEMYYDLDTKNANFAENSSINSLLAGSESNQTSSVYGEEYEIDKENLDHEVPFLVMDADASQFSALLDIQKQTNLSIEGPPGTGKSQTIVNAIADSLSKNKKVLFIAEKKAALDVVKARLDSINLGDFAFQVQANKSKKDAYTSIRDRLEITKGYDNQDYDFLIKSSDSSRAQIRSYIEIISSDFEDTGLKIYKILGKSIHSSGLIKSLPNNLLDHTIIDCTILPSTFEQELKRICSLFNVSWMKRKKSSKAWMITNKNDLSPFEIDDILNLSTRIAKVVDEGITINNKINSTFDVEVDIEDSLITFKDIKDLNFTPNYILTKYVIDNDLLPSVEDLSKIKHIHEINQKNYLSVVNKENPPPLSEILELKQFIEKNDISSIDKESINILVDKFIKDIEGTKIYLSTTQNILNKYPDTKKIQFDVISDLILILNEYEEDVLLLRRLDHFKFRKCSNIFDACLTSLNNICNKKNAVNDSINLDNWNIEELLTLLNNFKNLGFFSFLSKDSRETKKIVEGLIRNNNIPKNEQLKIVDKLREFCLSVREYKILIEDYNLLDINKFDTNSNYEKYKSLFELYMKIIKLDNNSALWDIGVSWQSNFLNFDDKIINTTYDTYKEYDLEDIITANSEITNKLKNLDKNSEYLINIRNKFIITKIGKDNIESISEYIKLYFESEQSIKKIIDGFNLPAGGKNYIEKIIKQLPLIKLIDNSKHKNIILDKIKSTSINDLVKLCASFNKCYSEKESLLNDFELLIDSDSDLRSITKFNINTKKYYNQLSNDKSGLIAYTSYNQIVNDSNAFSLIPIIKHLEDEDENIEKLYECAEAIIYRDLTRKVYEEYNELSTFNGTRLNQLVEEYKNNDERIIELNRLRLKELLIKNAKPPSGISRGRKSEYTELALINNEINKKTRHISIRNLANRSGKALLELMPCWMMSPHAVARFIDKNNINFDLVIIDEASQMTPENALGALYRAKNALIVGDTNQLPPTNYFKKMFLDDIEDEDNDVLEESILEMANITFKPIRRLKWHYRSRHSSLIAFSNKYIYDESLIIFPSSDEEKVGMGVSLRYVEGIYKNHINYIEAEHIVEEAIKIMTTRPSKSLGIVSMNIKQRDTIDDLLTQRIENNKKALEYKYSWEEKDNGLEKIFVKNLENVQGDERDIILISTLYRPEEKGAKVRKSFGPVSGVSGKRRLNVLFSRAKDQMVTFTSMTSHDLNVDENSNPGAYLLKLWLEYSETGKLPDLGIGDRSPDSEFERFVIQQLENKGFIAVPQVGVAGYFIDIGVKHPDYKHGFIMSVECDGASYHSSKSARDRDRLRQQVIEGLGWEFHRIWSTDWFSDPKGETERLINNLNHKLQSLLSGKALDKEKIKKKKMTSQSHLEKDIQVPPPLNEEKPPVEVSPKKEDIYKISDENKDLNKVGVDCKVTIEYQDNKKLRSFILINGKNDLENELLCVRSGLGEVILDANKNDIVELETGGFIREIKIVDVVQMEK